MFSAGNFSLKRKRNRKRSSNVIKRSSFKNLSFLNMQMTLLLNFYLFLSAENNSQGTHKTRKPYFTQLETQKNPFFDFFRKGLIMPKELSARKTIFSQAEISYESEAGTL